MMLKQAMAASPAPATIDTSEFGMVEIHAPRGTAKGFVFLFSGDRGLDAADRNAVRALIDSAFLVAAIDSQSALKGLDETGADKECSDLPGPLEWVSRIQHEFKLERYLEPVLVGRETGGALVYAALAQAPPLSFAGGVSVDFTPAVRLDRKLCGLSSGPVAGHRQKLLPSYSLHGWWRVAGTGALLPEVLAFARTSAHANETRLPEPGPPAALADLYVRIIGRQLNFVSPVGASIKDLPLVEVSASSINNTLAIIYSGDGGWRDIDKNLGDLLKTKGVAVVGVDALRYFWSKRDPAETARDLGRIIRYYRNAWKVGYIVLIGYSFGADVLPFAYNRLPHELQDAVILLSLLAPAQAADFEIQIFGWLGAEASSEALPTGPEVRNIDPAKIQCFYGDEEPAGTLCKVDAMRNAEIIERPGSHHFDENYAALAQFILEGIRKRIPGPVHRR